MRKNPQVTLELPMNSMQSPDAEINKMMKKLTPTGALWIRISQDQRKTSGRELAQQLATTDKYVSSVRCKINRNVWVRKRGGKKPCIVSEAIEQVIIEIMDTRQCVRWSDFRKGYFEKVGHNLEISDRTLRRTIKRMRAHHRQPCWEHPNKWKKNANVSYYFQYLDWRNKLSFTDVLKLKFQDECHVDKNSQGGISVYTRRGMDHYDQRFKRGETVQAMTIFGLTNPTDLQTPLIWRIVDVHGTGEEYFTFFRRDCLGLLHSCDSIVVDGAAFHVYGDFYEAIATVCHVLEINYYKLPTYSPELNPIEVIWAIFKRRLNAWSKST